MSQPCSGDAAAYVLGALDPHELDAFRRHLSSCAVCRDEVAALQPVVDMLPASVPQHAAPRAVKRRLMASVRGEARAQVRIARPRLRFVPVAAGFCALAVGLVVGLGTSSAPKHHVIAAQNTSAPGATAELIRYGSSGQLSVSGMPAAARGRVYEIWERVGTQIRPTDALFNVSRDGHATAGVPGDLSHVNTVMVTSEPDGGSQAPTSTPVIVVTL